MDKAAQRMDDHRSGDTVGAECALEPMSFSIRTASAALAEEAASDWLVKPLDPTWLWQKVQGFVGALRGDTSGRASAVGSWTGAKSSLVEQGGATELRGRGHRVGGAGMNDRKSMLHS